MFSQLQRSPSGPDYSDVESTVSDDTSRSTATDSWYDVKSDAEQQQIKQLDKVKKNNLEKQTLDDDQALIQTINDIYINDTSSNDGEEAVHAADSVSGSLDKKQETQDNTSTNQQ
jgi:hypothetical protein